MTESSAQATRSREQPTRSRARQRESHASHTWRSGGSSVKRWDWELVGWAVLLLGAGMLLAILSDRMIGGIVGAVVATLALWAGMVTPVVLGLVRSRPRMLLQFHPLDVLYGLVLGVVLRLAQGFIEIAGTGTAVWPSVVTFNGALPSSFWFDGVVAPVLLAPIIEEFFFHAVLLVALYSAVRRMTDSRTWAGVVSVVATALAFVGLHLVFAPYTWWGALPVLLLGLVCGALVVSTARIWPAVLTHVVFNATWSAMVVISTIG